jgi:Skp family chaperone for outer membrane proteins
VRPDKTQTDWAGSQGKVIPALVLVQLLIAVVALAAMVFVGTKIGPLLREKAQLEADIAGFKEDIAHYQQEVTTLQSDLKRAKAALEDTKTELEQMRERLHETVEMARFMHKIDLVDLKVIFSRHPRPAQALERILAMKDQGVGWHLGGVDPSQGFDSPSFAAYILKELGVTGVAVEHGDTLLATSRKLFDKLPPTDHPKVGDLVFYPAGYVLFYFEDQERKPFVIGMTPVGIAALDPDFASPVGYRKSGLAE